MSSRRIWRFAFHRKRNKGPFEKMTCDHIKRKDHCFQAWCIPLRSFAFYFAQTWYQSKLCFLQRYLSFYWTYISSIFQTSFFLTCWLKALRLGKESSFFFFLGGLKKGTFTKNLWHHPAASFWSRSKSGSLEFIGNFSEGNPGSTGKPGWILFLRVTCLRQKVTGKQAQI